MLVDLIEQAQGAVGGVSLDDEDSQRRASDLIFKVTDSMRSAAWYDHSDSAIYRHLANDANRLNGFACEDGVQPAHVRRTIETALQGLKRWRREVLDQDYMVRRQAKQRPRIIEALRQVHFVHPLDPGES
jgi:hypothetical protein